MRNGLTIVEATTRDGSNALDFDRRLKLTSNGDGIVDLVLPAREVGHYTIARVTLDELERAVRVLRAGTA